MSSPHICSHLHPSLPQTKKSLQTVPYSDLILNSPEEIAPKLRKFHETNDPERQVIVQAMIDIISEDSYASQWEAFFSSELYKVCIDILQDDASYAPNAPENYTGLTLLLLRLHGAHLSHLLRTSQGEEEALALARAMLRLLPPLWKYVWEEDLLAIIPPRKYYRVLTEVEDLPISLLSFLHAAVHLHCHCYGTPPPVTEHTAHLALYAWTLFDDHESASEDALHMSSRLIDDAPRELLQPFFMEAVLDRGITIMVAERFCLALLEEHNFDAPLHGIMSLLTAVSCYCSPVQHIPVERSPHTLLQCVRIACQRQLCRGRDEATTDSVLGQGLSITKNVVQDCLEGGRAQEEYLACIATEEMIKIIPMIARTTMYVLGKKNLNLFYCLRYILQVYGTNCDRPQHGVVTRTADVARTVWYPTVLALRAYPVPLNDGDGVERVRDAALRSWLEFGRMLGFNERVEERRARTQHPGEDGDTHQHAIGSRACRWRDCLCSSDERPPHKMRMCKGCWRVWYCGSKCQAKDWLGGGHREYCYAHRSQE